MGQHTTAVPSRNVSSEWHHKSPVYEWLSEEVKRVDIRDLRDSEGKPISFRLFYAGVKKTVSLEAEDVLYWGEGGRIIHKKW